jgi:hydrogenase/urease accessory protein HupE
MAHTTSMNHEKLAKGGFLLGLALFAVGAVGELVAHSLFTELPGWEQTLLFDMIVFGVLIALLAPLLFGIVIPLIE